MSTAKQPLGRNKRGVARDDKAAIKAAIENDCSTYKSIQEATGISAFKIREYFTLDRELYATYKVRRKMLVEMAADNIQAIIEDKEHPHHFSASKYVLQHYKSDLDEVLDSKEDELEITPGDDGKSVVINFGVKPKEESDD